MDYTTLLEGDSGARESAKLSRIRRILRTVGDSIQNGVRRSGGASVSNSLSLSFTLFTRTVFRFTSLSRDRKERVETTHRRNAPFAKQPSSKGQKI